MGRRRLQLHYSSDEEAIQHQQQLPSTSQTPFSPNPNPNLDPNPIPLDISDDDFQDVPEDLSPPSPPISSSNSPIFEFLLKLGLKLRLQWLDSCISGLSSSIPGFATLDVSGKAKLCFEQFLFSDMNVSGGGALPQDLHALHLVDLPGPFVLQIDEIVNLSCSLRDRYKNAPAGLKRCLKLSMTDGVQRIFGIEYRPIKNLEVLAPAGLKVAVRNVNIRRGLLMLVPEVFEVLGGLVESLDAARQRLVEEINKPPRGKRTREGAVPSLASRATLAAWPSNNDHGRANRSMSQGTIPNQSSNQASIFSPNASETVAAMLGTGINTSERVVDESSVPNSMPNVESNTLRNAESNPSTNATVAVEGITVDAASIATSRDNREWSAEDFTCSRDRPYDEPIQFLDATSDARDIDMADVEHAILLTGIEKTPFTYLASLFAKWFSKSDDIQSVQGKIKCLSTGVKGFQFKKRTKYELKVYVDDGSLISEVLIDHSVVQKLVGFSPEEVTAAFDSSETSIVSNMKEAMKSFQVFLANFEGTMLLEMNQNSPPPVALEMEQGCSTSDAWSLLQRLTVSASHQTPEPQHPEPIDISP